MSRIILLGAPGSGKGSQATNLIRKLRVPQISTGDMLREARKEGTDLGKLAGECMDKGTLVPDSLIIDLIKERIRKPDCLKGFILDGFPRTIPQAESLEHVLDELGISIDHVIEIKIQESIIVPRIAGRRSCPDCKRPYHVTFTPPKKVGYCDDCNVPLIQRSDDTEEAVHVRLVAYNNQTAPLVEYYGKKGLVREVDGSGRPDDVTVRIFQFLT
jgi:adenylate kinase